MPPKVRIHPGKLPGPPLIFKEEASLVYLKKEKIYD